MPKVINKNDFISAAYEVLGEVEFLDRQDILRVTSAKGISYPNWLTTNKQYRKDRGSYFLPKIDGTKHNLTSKTVNVKPNPEAVEKKQPHSEFIPLPAAGYVPFGHYDDLKNILSSGKFFPVYITGLSGNGKTMMIEQVASNLNRECVRVNVTRETDEDDLLGGFRLINGETVWHDGPVITAMKRGAVLLLDEVDLGDAKLMCLQPVLEGKAIFLKKIATLVRPAEGFNIVATANTKGRGSEDGKFIGTNVMNEAFLERFSITFEQEYPPKTAEKKMLQPIIGKENIAFAECLIDWANAIRKSFADGATNEIISTRRLVHICEAFNIFGQDKMKAIRVCLNRFDATTRDDFIKAYTKIDVDANGTANKTTDAKKADAKNETYSF
tara:strand:+ start:4848 stop:5999 length:1152 start_codon:yes stop_codon:yes gene_type:complete